MKRVFTNTKILKNTLTVLFLVVTSLVSAQDDTKFTAQVSKNKLGVNEKLRIEFSFNENGDNFKAPSFQNFQIVMGPSASSSYQWVNGKSSFSKKFTYILAPTKEGVFSIGSASITFDGKTYTTKPIDIEVTKAVKNTSQNGSTTGQMTTNIDEKAIFGVTEISNTSPYINEAVSVVYKVYISPRVGISDLRPTENPKYQDFWSHDIPLSRYEVEDCTYKGEPYKCVVVKRIVLYPQKSGKLVLEPMNVKAVMQIPTEQRDFFGRRLVEEIDKNLTIGKRTIRVKALPEAGKPDSFSGAVGEFDFEVSLSKESLKANESLQAKINIKGEGNLKLFDFPKLIFPASLEVYEPESDEDIQTNISGMKGSTTESYTVVPQYKGKFPINPIVFTYFNPRTKKYVSIHSKKLLIEVTEGPTAATTGKESPNTTVPNQPIESANQFRFLKLKPDLQPINQAPFFGSKAFWLWLLLPLLFIPIVILIWGFRRKRMQDVTGNRIRSANRLARKYLSTAKKEIGNKDAFYEALERSLHNYLKAKLHIETSELSKEKIIKLLQQKSVSDTLINDFITLLKNCEMARYSMHTQADMQNDYDNAAQILSKMDKMF